jgi:GGDEF domain-containing protein
MFASKGFRLPGNILLDNTLSVGIVGYPDHPVKDFKALVVKADKAMYLAKKQGGGQVVVV